MVKVETTIDQFGRRLNTSLASKLKRELSEQGYSHVRCDNAKVAEQLLLDAQSEFGELIRHDRSREDGLVPVQFKPGLAEMDRLISDTSNEVRAHMDGTFMHEPPSVIALAVIEMSSDAPQTYSMDFHDLMMKLPDCCVLRHAQEGVATIVRVGQSTQMTPLQFTDGRIHVRYRYDEAVEVIACDDKSPLFRDIDDQISVTAPRYHDLAPGSVIFFDNLRMLHGRRQFNPLRERRLLLRAWYNKASLPSNNPLMLGVPWSGKSAVTCGRRELPPFNYRNQTIQIEGLKIVIRWKQDVSGKRESDINSTVFAAKQAIGFRHSPLSWQERRGASSIQLIPQLPATVDEVSFGQSLAGDLALLLN